MADEFKIELQGIDALNSALAAAAKTIRTKAVRSALRRASRSIVQHARQAAPVLKAPERYRTPGTVKRNIVARPSKFARRAGNEGVFIGVRPLRGKRQKVLGKASAKNPNDPFYWYFLEFGTRKMKARRFLAPAAEAKGQEAVQTFMREVVPQIEKLNRRAGNVR